MPPCREPTNELALFCQRVLINESTEGLDIELVFIVCQSTVPVVLGAPCHIDYVILILEAPIRCCFQLLRIGFDQAMISPSILSLPCFPYDICTILAISQVPEINYVL